MSPCKFQHHFPQLQHTSTGEEGLFLWVSLPLFFFATLFYPFGETLETVVGFSFRCISCHHNSKANDASTWTGEWQYLVPLGWVATNKTHHWHRKISEPIAQDAHVPRREMSQRSHRRARNPRKDRMGSTRCMDSRLRSTATGTFCSSMERTTSIIHGSILTNVQYEKRSVGLTLKMERSTGSV